MVQQLPLMRITIQKATLANLDELAILFNEHRMFYKQDSSLPEGIRFLKELKTTNQKFLYHTTTKERDWICGAFRIRLCLTNDDRQNGSIY